MNWHCFLPTPPEQFISRLPRIEQTLHDTHDSCLAKNDDNVVRMVANVRRKIQSRVPQVRVLAQVALARTGLNTPSDQEGLKACLRQTRAPPPPNAEWQYRTALSLSRNGRSDVMLAKDVVRLSLWGISLIVLSACNTANGDVAVGEGTVSLRRYVEAARAATTVSFFWPVLNTGTVELIRDFYVARDRGQRICQALSTAEKVFLSSGQPAIEWAGFNMERAYVACRQMRREKRSRSSTKQKGSSERMRSWSQRLLLRRVQRPQSVSLHGNTAITGIG